MSVATCPCGSKNTYQHCCGLYIDQAQNAPTPEALMRSRYTAYTQAKVDYIRKTMRGRAVKHFDEKTAKQWALTNEWQKLEVLQSSISENNLKQGFVEFKAYFRTKGQDICMHELSEFEYNNGQWLYIDGQTLPRPIQASKVGRNDPCACGSGKKFKKCCGLSVN